MQFLSSFFGDKPLAVLGVVVALIVLVAFIVILVRALGGHNFRAPGGRMRQQRLGVVDAFDLDRQRQLVLIRRDNVEHLVMIGGPNDVLLEAAIIRQPAATAALSRTEPPPPALPASAAAAIGALRPPSSGPEPRPDFEAPGREPGLPPAPGLAGVAASTPTSPSGPRLPFPPRVASPTAPPLQRPPAHDASRDSAPHPVAPAARPEPALTVQPAAPAAQPQPVPGAFPQAPLAGSAAAAPPVAPPPARLNPVRAGPPPRPLRPFPTLRPGGGPLFPVRPSGAPAQPAAANAPKDADASEAREQPPAGTPPEGATAPAKPGGPTNVLDSFESLEEEMAKLLGRPGPDQS